MGTLHPGSQIHGRYEIKEPIGQGGFGAVYKAIDTRLGRPVAVKQLLRGGDRIMRQFEREAQLLANLSHPALPRVTDHFSDANNTFLVMDFVTGDDLGTLLVQQDAPFPVDQVLRWGMQLLDALHYLHSRQPPIIHRDIKPQNLKIQDDGRIMLLDFGLAKGFAGNVAPPTTESSFLAYTKGYAPPEQVESTGTDARSDLYSLAGTLHCLLTNTGPVEAQTRLLAAARGKPDPLRPAHELNPDVPEAVSRVLTQAMQLEPDARPASAKEMRAMLAQVSGRPTMPLGAVTPEVAHTPAPATDIAHSDMLTDLLGISPAPARPAVVAQPSRRDPLPHSIDHEPVVVVPAPSRKPASRREIRLPRRRVMAVMATTLVVTILALALAPVVTGNTAHLFGPTPVVPTATPTPLDAVAVADRLRPSTVMVRASFPETPVSEAGTGSGTGIVISDNGLILTNAHVVAGASDVSIALAGSDRRRAARVIGRSSCDDLAVLKVDNLEGLVPATMGQSSALKAGETVYALGYPLGAAIGTDMSITRGIISKRDLALESYESLIQTDAAVNQGNSGGPLVNVYGEVIGINTLAISADVATNVNFAISIDQAKGVVNILKEGQNRYWLGMNLTWNRYSEYFGVEGGMVVVGVDTGSPAARGGIEPAGLLTQIEGTEVNSLAAVCRILRSHSDGDQLKVQLLYRTEHGRVLLEGEIALGDPEATTEKLKIIATDEPTATARPVKPEPATFTEDFRANTGRWVTGHADWVDAAIAEGSYHVVLHMESRIFTSPAPVDAASDMGIATSVLVQGNAIAGVAVRYNEQGDSESYYACGITAQNQYMCFMAVNGEFTTLIEPTYSDAIRPGVVNQVVLAVDGNTLTLVINQQQVTSFHDNSLAAGSTALVVISLEAEVGARFDNVVVVTSNG